MAKPHWQIFTEDSEGNRTVESHGCQHTECNNRATWQWQREATDEEMAAEAATAGPYGELHRNPQGPHSIAVFSCDEHTPKRLNADNEPEHDLDWLAKRHNHDCVAPDPGCEC